MQLFTTVPSRSCSFFHTFMLRANLWKFQKGKKPVLIFDENGTRRVLHRRCVAQRSICDQILSFNFQWIWHFAALSCRHLTWADENWFTSRYFHAEITFSFVHARHVIFLLFFIITAFITTCIRHRVQQAKASSKK